MSEFLRFADDVLHFARWLEGYEHGATGNEHIFATRLFDETRVRCRL
jgi:hypothetical protein